MHIDIPTNSASRLDDETLNGALRAIIIMNMFTNILKISTQSQSILGTTGIAGLGRAAVSDGIERECGEPPAVKQTASSFCEIRRAPRCANGDVKSFVFGGLGAV